MNEKQGTIQSEGFSTLIPRSKWISPLLGALAIVSGSPAQAGVITFSETEFAAPSGVSSYTIFSLSDMDVGIRNAAFIKPQSPYNTDGFVAYTSSREISLSSPDASPFNLVSFDYTSNAFHCCLRADYIFYVSYRAYDNNGDLESLGQFFNGHTENVYAPITVQLNLQNLESATISLYQGANSSDIAMFDNISYSFGALGGVPEPGVWAMLILGFGAVGGSLRRKRTTARVAFRMA